MTGERQVDPLHPLRTQLQRLARRRARLRIANAVTSVLTFIPLALVGLFALDVAFDLDRTQRLCMIVAAVTSVSWISRNFAFELFQPREDNVEVAIGIGDEAAPRDDVVAALQFTTTSSVGESEQLRRATIGRVASATRDWKSRAKVLGYARLACRFAILTACSVAASLIFVNSGSYAAVFFERLLLRPSTYPTETKIDRISVNGQLLDPNTEASVSLVDDDGLVVRVLVKGKKPARGRLRLEGASTGAERSVELIPGNLDAEVGTSQDADLKGKANRSEHDRSPAIDARSRAESSAGQQGAYLARLDRLAESGHFRVLIGDAESPPIHVELLSRPLVEVVCRVTPPSYLGRAEFQLSSGSRQFFVPHGSRVELEMRALGQPLSAATLRVTEASESQVLKDISEGSGWRFAGIPFDEVTGDVDCELNAVSEHNVSLRDPIKCAIRIQQDESPTVRLSTVHEGVVPSAKPRFAFVVSDDFAVSRLLLRLSVESVSGAGGQPQANSSAIELPIHGEDSILRDFPYRGEHVLDFGLLDLVPGDRVAVVLEAVDYRGTQLEGTRSRSDAVYLDVVDEGTVLSSVTNSDSKVERLLTDIIEQQRKVQLPQ